MPQPETLLEGKYEILSKIREGGMGTIYLVRHRLLDRIRVIKVMREHVSADPDLKRRFIEEAKTATRLSHPNICTIHDFAVDEEATAYLVMEFIEGVNVSELLGMKGPPGVALSLEIAHQTLLALGYLHRKHVIHRDVAPDNLMLTKTEEGSPLVKVIDLGIAKAADRPTEMTASGVFLGKLRYASPEQAGALGPGERLDGRSDLYSLGVILYELLTGMRPFAGESPAEMLRGHLFQPPLPFSESDPKGVVPPELRAVVLKALEKKRDDRYTSAEEFDREVLVLQQRLRRGDDRETTHALLATIPTILESSRGPVTPSAQGRLDGQFGAHTTPRPSAPHMTIAPTVSVTSLEKKAAMADLHPRRGLSWILAIAAVAGIAIAARLMLRPTPGGATKDRVAVLPAPPRSAASSDRAAEPTLAPPSPVPSPAPTEPPVPTPPPPAAVPVIAPTRRRAADLVRPTAAPPAVIAGALLRPTAEAVNPRPTPATARSDSPGAAPTIPLDRGSVPPLPPSPVKSGDAESDRIRETVRRYEKAQSTLDANLYALVFPSVDRARIERAFASFQSQSVEFEIRRIQIDPGGLQARVYGYEKRIAVPRAGSEQRINADRVLHVEKRGDAWVITELN